MIIFTLSCLILHLTFSERVNVKKFHIRRQNSYFTRCCASSVISQHSSLHVILTYVFTFHLLCESMFVGWRNLRTITGQFEMKYTHALYITRKIATVLHMEKWNATVRTRLLRLLFQAGHDRVSADNIVSAFAKRRSFNPIVPLEHDAKTPSTKVHYTELLDIVSATIILKQKFCAENKVIQHIIYISI